MNNNLLGSKKRIPFKYNKVNLLLSAYNNISVISLNINHNINYFVYCGKEIYNLSYPFSKNY